MTHVNPLIVETARGLTRTGRAQMDYLLYLFVLAAAVFIWWPKHTLTEILQRQDPPDTLLAAIVVCGAIVAWYSARAGAEEFLLDGQHGLRDWAAGTTLALPRILLGYAGAHLLHSMHLIALSLPVVLLAFHISGGQWPALSVCLAMIILQSMFYRFVAAAIYIALGQHGTLTAIGIRAFIVAVYLFSALAMPVASQFVITSSVLDGGSSPYAIHVTSAPMQFLALYAALGACTLLVLYQQLSRLRARQAHGNAAP